MGASSYPGMTQPFSMAHGTNMGSVGVRQDTMGKRSIETRKFTDTYPGTRIIGLYLKESGKLQFMRRN